MQEQFRISAGVFYFFSWCFLATLLWLRCQKCSKGGLKKGKILHLHFHFLLVLHSLCAAFPLPLASNVAAFNLEIMVTCMCILRVYHCCS